MTTVHAARTVSRATTTAIGAPARIAAAGLALACVAIGGFLAAHYPYSPRIVLALFLVWIAAAWRYPLALLVALPAALPVIDFAPWTGRIVFEEWDIVVLGAAAGGYLGLAFGAAEPPDSTKRSRGNPAGVMLFVLFGLSGIIALYRGFADAGGLHFGWSQGYYDPLNSLRVFKGFIAAMLLAPLALRQICRSRARATSCLALGLALGCGAASLYVLWERAAFPGVLNFSSDYRTTGSFWEMHVGGAALDGFLALTLPFTLWSALRARTPVQALACALLVALAFYASLVTFSRGVYLAIPFSLGTLAVLLHRRGAASAKGARAIGLRDVVIVAVAAVLCYLVFRHGGYRALAAALGVFAISVTLGGASRPAGIREWVIAGFIGASLGAAAALAGTLASKGVYVAYAIGLAAAGSATFLWRRLHHERWRMPALAACVGVAVLAGVVARHWGGESAGRDSAAALLAMVALAVWNTRTARPLGGGRLRAQAVVVAALGIVAGIITVLSAGAYMSGRFAAGESDFSARWSHWTEGVGMLRKGGDWLLGKGLGRFPTTYFFSVAGNVFPGSYALAREGEASYLALSGPRYPTSSGDLFRVSQRVVVRPGRYTIAVDARAKHEARLHLEICEKHLLYSEHCAISEVPVTASSQPWQHIAVTLDTTRFVKGPWYAAKPAFFSLAVETSAQVIDVGRVSVVDVDGRDVIANGNFADGMTHWFFTSDRYHLPWHIKNLALDVLFDQGAIGLALFALLVIAAAWRVAFGAAAGNPLSPWLAAGMAGFVVVGMFDSLVDVPRLAFLFYWLLAVAMFAPQENAWK
jgi:hypothetical protein